MELSLFLAKVLGLYLVIFGLALLYNRASMVKAVNEVFSNSGCALLLAIMTLIVGILLVVSHNVWVMAWPVAITILAWLILLKGVMRLYCPAKAKAWMKKIESGKVYYTITTIALLLGAYLTYIGFGL